MRDIEQMLMTAKRALMTAPYQALYCAMNSEGKSCSPLDHGVALSYRGALIAGSGGGQRSWRLDAWMGYHHLLPAREPRSKKDALALINQALDLIGTKVAA